MAWNEPGGGNRDPWSGSGRDQGPPDLDELFKKAQARLRRLFGRSGGENGDGGGGGGVGTVGVALVVAIILGVWLLSGLYIVDEGKRGVVLRFGEYSRTTMPGMHWHWPYPLEEVRAVDVASRRIIRIGYGVGTGSRSQSIASEGLMLTQDEAIVNVQLAVQWQVSDPSQYLFTLLEPEQTLKQLTESALREAVGKRTLDFVLTEGRTEVVEATRDLVQEGLERYKAGISLVEVAIQDVQPPEEVQEAFADVIRAREDEQRLINEARAYSNQVLPRASGEAARILEEAQGYKVRVTAEAEGETDRFLALLAEYRQAPEVTRERLYLETMEQVLSQTSKALLDVENGQPLMYLPLDKMMERSRRASGAEGAEGGNGGRAAAGSGGAAADGAGARDRLRSREVR
jgi:membrane protease subunit HflK